MINYKDITHLALDADDTLWLNEPIFVNTQEACRVLIRPYLSDPAVLDHKLYEFEKRNLALFGYGVKGFVLSMIETVIELSDGKATGHDIQRIIDLGKEMLQHPVHLLDTVAETVAQLAGQFTLLVVTKGDLFDQENKLARSGLADYFDIVEIVSEKNPATYKSILDRHQIPAEQFLMVGNSLKSDVLPVFAAGAQAIHIPYHTTWTHETVEEHQLEGYQYTEISQLAELVDLLGS